MNIVLVVGNEDAREMGGGLFSKNVLSETHVVARRVHVRFVEGIDDNVAFLYLLENLSVGQDHRLLLRLRWVL